MRLGLCFSFGDMLSFHLIGGCFARIHSWCGIRNWSGGWCKLPEMLRPRVDRGVY
jgi:hypothetical protein